MSYVIASFATGVLYMRVSCYVIFRMKSKVFCIREWYDIMSNRQRDVVECLFAFI